MPSKWKSKPVKKLMHTIEIPEHKRVFTDQMGEQVVIKEKVERIISLVPSQTELLYTLNLGNKLAGRTKFCIHPESELANVPKIGGTKSPDLERITRLKPDLIIGNKEENDKASIELLKTRFPVWMSDIENYEDSLQMILALGELLGVESTASALVKEINIARNDLRLFALDKFHQHPPGVVYMIWRKPFMAAGTATFISHMLADCGFVNLAEGRYPELTTISLKALRPEIIFLSSEPYPFKEKHVSELKEICPYARIMLVDGEMFSWYGSRMRLAYPYFKQLLLSI